MVATRALHLQQELLREGAPVRQLGQLVGERVLLLGREQLRVAYGDRGLGRDTVEEVGLVLAQLPPGVQVQLHRAHQLSGALDRDDQRVPGMPALVQAWRRPVVEVDDKRAHCGEGGAQGLLLDLAHAAAGPVGEVVRRLAVELGLARPDQVHRPGDRAHDPPGVREGHVQDLLEG